MCICIHVNTIHFSYIFIITTYETAYHNVFGELSHVLMNVLYLFPICLHHCDAQCHLESFMDKRLYSGQHYMYDKYLNI